MGYPKYDCGRGAAKLQSHQSPKALTSKNPERCGARPQHQLLALFLASRSGARTLDHTCFCLSGGRGRRLKTVPLRRVPAGSHKIDPGVALECLAVPVRYPTQIPKRTQRNHQNTNPNLWKLPWYPRSCELKQVKVTFTEACRNSRQVAGLELPPVSLLRAPPGLDLEEAIRDLQGARVRAPLRNVGVASALNGSETSFCLSVVQSLANTSLGQGLCNHLANPMLDQSRLYSVLLS